MNCQLAKPCLPRLGQGKARMSLSKYYTQVLRGFGTGNKCENERAVDLGEKCQDACTSTLILRCMLVLRFLCLKLATPSGRPRDGAGVGDARALG
eukprot:scaffold104058_cov18-Tisochrysis_lutea.AAC.4